MKLIMNMNMIPMLSMFLNHPLMIGFYLILLTILISWNLSIMSYNPWLTYNLFLIMIGGMLILFIYMTSITSNKKFKFNLKMIYSLMIMFILMMLMNDNFNYLMKINNNNINYGSTTYLNYPSMYISLMMMIYLLITLTAVMKIIDLKMSSLRKM